MTRRLFDRVCRVISTPAPNDRYFGTDAVSTTIDQLRIQFTVEKSLESDPNTAEVVITNLRSGTRADVCRKPSVVRLDVGYTEDVGLRTLFTGDLRYGFSRTSGTDVETLLQLGDGSRAQQFAFVSETIDGSASVIDAIERVAASMGLVVPASVLQEKASAARFIQGVTLHGFASAELTRLVALIGRQWSIQDGKLAILADKEVGAAVALVISQETGMLESPEFGAPDTPNAAPSLSIKSLLYPQVTPGQLIDVRSRSVKGQFKVERVKHTGDTHSDTWFTEIEAKAAT